MTDEKYLVCDKCKKSHYACKRGRMDDSNSLAKFIEFHEHECDGPLFVYDESYLP